MPNGMYGGVRGKGTKTGQKTFVPRPTGFIGRAKSVLPDGKKKKEYFRRFSNLIFMLY